LSPISNIRVVSGKIAEGWPQGAPFDAIILEGASEIPPHALCRQLKEGGRLVCVLGSGPGSKAMLYCRTGQDIGGRPIFDASAPTLPGFEKPPAFAF
jgi:protein-L-isoaspartate(D-aspartate) O-methyltransferase